MTQLSVHRNANEATREAAPYLLDVQSPLLSELATRVVIPLRSRRSQGLQLRPIARLIPEVEVAGKKYLVMTPEMASIPSGELGGIVADLSASRAEILGSIDLLLTGF
jgi:toxin CcdB